MNTQRLLQGKNAIVTGARGGIGWAIVECFAEHGANIWACTRTRDSSFEERAAALAQRTGVWVKPVYFDLASEESVRDAVRGIVAEKRPVDVLVNNAGTAYGALFALTPMSALKDTFQVNFFAQIQITQMIVRGMMRRRSGCIINMASVGGIETTPGYLAYGSSKAALIYATKTLSHEVGDYGIRVNAIAPGLTETEMGRFKSEAEIQKVLDRSSLHRRAKPEEIAHCALFLASEQSSFITGQVMIADGGRLCV